MLERFSAGAIQALNAAREEALRLEFTQVDTDHLLLGLAHEHKGLAAKMFSRHGVGPRHLRVAVEQISGRGYSIARMEDLVFSPGTIRVLARTAMRRPTLVESQDVFHALLHEPDTAAEGVLRHLGLDPDALRDEADARVAGTLAEEAETPVEEGKVLPKRFVPRLLTPAGQSVLSYAYAATRFFGHTIVGTEQLLTALLYVRTGLASRVLEANDVDALEVEAVASRVIGRGSGTVPGRLSLSRRCEEVLDGAWNLARKLGHEQVGTGHVLLALIEWDAGGALYILDQLDINLAQIRYDVETAFELAPGEAEPEEGAVADGELAPS